MGYFTKTFFILFFGLICCLNANQTNNKTSSLGQSKTTNQQDISKDSTLYSQPSQPSQTPIQKDSTQKDESSQDFIQKKSTSKTIFLQDSTQQDSVIEKVSTPEDFEFPTYKDLDFANSLIKRFSLHNENYFLPIYYQTKAPDHYRRGETKIQISAKASIFQDLFWGLGMYFAYTQKSFFQIYSPKLSSPFRSNDYMPELIFYRPLDIPLFGGKIYNIRFGYKHNSNGEEDIHLSRGIDIAIVEIMYKIDTFKATLKAWAYIRKDPKDIDKYLGYSDLVLEYSFLSRNVLRLTISNLFHNYFKKYRGNVLLEYKFNFEHFALYAQYFFGYADNTYEYKHKKHGIGIGVAIASF